MVSSLTTKQENFCQAVLTEANTSDAYRKAYGGGNSKPESINRRAKELMANSKIIARLAELRAPAVKAAQITLTDHLNDLRRLRDLAEASEKYGPAIQAEVARGKASGLYVEKMEHTGANGQPIGFDGTVKVVFVDAPDANPASK